jgi:Tfp pilus assembly protein PilV
MIVAMVLLAVGIGGAVLAVGSSTRVSGASKDQTVMALLAQRRLTEIETEGVASGNGLVEGSDGGDFGDDYPDFSWEQEITTTDTTDLLQVTVRVIHRTRAQERTFELVTLRLAPPTSTGNTANTTGNTTGTGGTSGG